MPHPNLGLPPGWETIFDPKSGKNYYFNRSTNLTTWTDPTSLSRNAPQDTKPNSSNSTSSTSSTSSTNFTTLTSTTSSTSTSKKEKEKTIPKKSTTNNLNSKVTPHPNLGLPSNWVKKFDPNTGKHYYINIITHETSWTDPTSKKKENNNNKKKK